MCCKVERLFCTITQIFILTQYAVLVGCIIFSMRWNICFQFIEVLSDIHKVQYQELNLLYLKVFQLKLYWIASYYICSSHIETGELLDFRPCILSVIVTLSPSLGYHPPCLYSLNMTMFHGQASHAPQVGWF